MTAVEFEEILEYVGSNGKFQRILIWGLLMPLSFLISFSVSIF